MHPPVAFCIGKNMPGYGIVRLQERDRSLTEEKGISSLETATEKDTLSKGLSAESYKNLFGNAERRMLSSGSAFPGGRGRSEGFQ